MYELYLAHWTDIVRVLLRSLTLTADAEANAAQRRSYIMSIFEKLVSYNCVGRRGLIKEQ